MKPHNKFGVVVDDQSSDFTGQAIDRYLKTDANENFKYICATNVLEHGYFIHITIDHDVYDFLDFPMTIWIPTQLVKFVAAAENNSPLGFHTGAPSSDQL